MVLPRLGPALLCAPFVTGCGATCADIAVERQAFLQREAGPETAGPHLSLAVPLEPLNRELTAAIADLPSVDFALKGFEKVASKVGDTSLRLKRLVVIPGRRDRLGLRLEIAAVHGGSELFSLTLDGELANAIDPASGKVELVLHPDSLRNIEPQLSPRAARNLSRLVRSQLPEEIFDFLPEGAIDEAASGTLDWLARNLYPLLRDKVLARLGELGRVTLVVTELPLRRIGIESGADHVVFHLWTSLPVKKGLFREIAKTTDTASQDARLRVSGDALAEIANWAMANGHAPPVYDDEGKPDQNGGNAPGFGWLSDSPRKLQVRVFRTGATCMAMTMSGNPRLTLDHGQLQFEVGQAEVDSVRGPALQEVGAWLKAMWSGAINISKRVAASTELDVAGTRLSFTVTRARVTGDVVELGLKVDHRERK